MLPCCLAAKANKAFQFKSDTYYANDAHDMNGTAHYWAGNNDPGHRFGN
jgi:hypothetical protein